MLAVLAVLPRWMRMRVRMRRKKEAFFAGAALVWILSIFNSLHMLVHSTKPMVWPRNQTRSVVELISPEERTTLISPACRLREDATPEGQPSLLIVVESSLPNFVQRDVVRKSWARPSMVPASRAKVVFLVGQSVEGEFQDAIEAESDRHGDIVQERFIDSYYNLTVKSLMLVKWVTQNCVRFSYVLKADDDVFVNVKNLLDIIMRSGNPELLVGHLLIRARPIRDPYNKWFVPKYMMETHEYPDYLEGPAYLMSTRMARRLLEASHRVPIFHMEDVYLTGMLSRSIGVKPQYHPGFTGGHKAWPFDGCTYSQIVASHGLTNCKLIEMADQVERAEDCETLTMDGLQKVAGCWGHGKREEQFSRIIGDTYSMIEEALASKSGSTGFDPKNKLHLAAEWEIRKR